MELLGAIGRLPVAELLRNSPVGYPLVSAVHIMGLGLLFGTVVALDLRLLGRFASVPMEQFIPPLRWLAGFGFGVAVTTGLLLFSTRPLAYAANPAFLVKLGMIGLAALNLLAMTARAWPARPAAFVSLFAWVGAVLAGRWIGFLQ